MLATEPAERPQGRRLVAALRALTHAEARGAPEAELRLLQEAVIAARLSEARTAAHAGAVLSPTRLRQLARDQELLRRFPENRRGADGLDWFDWPTT